MSNIIAENEIIDFDSIIYDKNNKRIATEDEIATYDKFKIISSININASRPKVIAADSYNQVLKLVTGKLFSQDFDDIILGIATENVSALSETFLTTRGKIVDTGINGVAGDSVYANTTGELTLTITNCKVGTLLSNNEIFINLGKESSDNRITRLYEFISVRNTVPLSLRRLAMYSGFFEIDFPPSEQTNDYNCFAYGGNGLFVGVGSQGANRVVYSTDYGKTWNTATASDVTSTWSYVIYANGMFVAISDSGPVGVMTSPDGINWTNRIAPLNQWKELTYGNGVYVAISPFGAERMMTSTDAITWTSNTIDLENWESIAYGNGIFIAINSSATNDILKSPDGINWTASSIGGPQQWRAIRFSNFLNSFVAFGTYIYNTTADGITWVSSNEIQVGLLNTLQPTDFRMENSITLVGTSTNELRCFFGIISKRTIGANPVGYGVANTLATIKSVCYGDGIFIANTFGGGPNKIFRSAII